MNSTLYLENFLEGLENLPVEVHRNLTLMRDLDSRTQELMCNIDELTDDYMSNFNKYSLKKKKESMATIQHKYNKAKEYSDDKFQLSKQTYELVDKHIRKLDIDLKRFEGEIQAKATRKIEEGLQKRGSKKTIDKEIIKTSEEEKVTKTPRKKQLKKGGAKTTSAAPSKTPLVNVVTNVTNPTNSVASVAVEASSLTGALVGAGVAHSAEVLDMPVDPNEPTYCLCNQVSYGEMIGCDNPDCPIEWFHFACVKLITKPKGKWFCPKCITDKKKK